MRHVFLASSPDDLYEPDSASMAGHRRLLEQVIIRAVLDAHSVDTLVRREARAWFEMDDGEPFGWRWVQRELRVSRGTGRRIKDYALSAVVHITRRGNVLETLRS